MVLWGAICGGVLGLLWRGHDWEIHMLVGVVLGALAGRGLRGAVRAEIKAALAAKPAARPVVAAPAVDGSRRPQDFRPTLPQPLPGATRSAPDTCPAAHRAATASCPAAEAAATRFRQPPHSAGHGPGCSAAIPSCAWACWCCSSAWHSSRSTPSTMHCCRPSFGWPPSARRASRCSRAASGCAARHRTSWPTR